MEFKFKTVEGLIGYTFNNKTLLQQAFTRRSYSRENGGNDNEVLEFIGDKVLDFAVVYMLSNAYGKLNHEGYTTTRDEGTLTELKAAMVDADSLSVSADTLGLPKYLICGKSDLNNHGISKSMKEDLVEAVIGAVALDSNWNLKKTFDVVDRILEVNKIIGKNSGPINYVGELQEYLAKLNVEAPVYTYQQRNGMWVCDVEVKAYRSNMFGVGMTKKEARQAAAQSLLSFFKTCDDNIHESNEFYGIIGEPSEENALQQVNQLIQAGLISKPKYEYSCEYDEDGNPIWTCNCYVKEIEGLYFDNNDRYRNSKKVAQRNAAFCLLQHLVGND